MSRYTVYVLPDEFHAIKQLPGNVRQRVKRAIDELANDPRPSNSKQLDLSDEEDLACEVRRLRIHNWRVVYLITEEQKAVDVVAVRKRPPYDYGDLAELLGVPTRRTNKRSADRQPPVRRGRRIELGGLYEPRTSSLPRGGDPNTADATEEGNAIGRAPAMRRRMSPCWTRPLRRDTSSARQRVLTWPDCAAWMRRSM